MEQMNDFVCACVTLGWKFRGTTSDYLVYVWKFYMSRLYDFL